MSGIIDEETDEWVHELAEVEPGNSYDEMTESSARALVDGYDSLEDVWDDVYWEQNYQNPSRIGDTGFRMPYRDEDRPSCLGKAVMLSLFAEFDSDDHDIGLEVYYDDTFAEDGTTDLHDPHVTSVIDGEERGEKPGYDNSDPLPISSLPDLYKLGLGVQVLNEGRDIDGLEYGQLKKWGGNIKERYSTDTPKPDSHYMSKLGAEMEDEAENERIAEGDDAEWHVS
jgi:hypothetical protein